MSSALWVLGAAILPAAWAFFVIRILDWQQRRRASDGHPPRDYQI